MGKEKKTKELKFDDYDSSLEDEFEELDKEMDKKDKGNKDDFKKLILKLSLLIGGGILLLIIILSLSSSISNRNTSYEKIENIMIEACKKYMNDNPDYLKMADKKIVQVPVANLVAGGYMKDLSEYNSTSECTGKVYVNKVGGQYVYSPNLDCGDQYNTVPLYTKVMEDSPIVKSGYGLYNLHGTKVFRGEKVNNYVQLEKYMWRIVKIDNSNSAYLIKDKYIGYTSAWDNRYNEDIGYNVGINNFAKSRMRDYLLESYNTAKESDIFLSLNDKSKMVDYTLCIGSRATYSKTNSNAIECKTKLPNQKMGLLTVSDYINASTDPKCVTASDKNCQNYNYLVDNFDWWLQTPVTNTTDKAYSVNIKGEIKVSQTGDYYNVRPVIKLNSMVSVAKGTGSKDDPYILK